MTIDTNDATPYSGIISSWTLNGAGSVTSITVPGFYLMNGACLANQANCVAADGGAVPFPTGGAAVSRQQKIFGTNFVTTRNTASEAVQATVQENDCNNNTGVDDTGDTMAVAPTVAYDGCYDAVNLGNARASYGYIARGKFVSQINLQGDSTQAIHIAPIGANVVTFGIQIFSSTTVPVGYSYQGPTSGEAWRNWTTGGDILGRLYANSLNLGRQKTTGTAFNIKIWSSASGNNDDTLPDATWLYSGGSGASNGSVLLSAGNFQYSQGTFGVSLINNAVQATGTATDQALSLASKGAGSIVFRTNTNVTNQGFIVHTANATEAFTLSGAATGNAPSIGTSSSDSQTPGIIINPLGNTIIGAGVAVANNAVVGLLQLPTTAGAPSGTVGALGKAAVLIDTTNKKICYSTGGGTWECSAAFTP
jgi:hypothetical protein